MFSLIPSDANDPQGLILVKNQTNKQTNHLDLKLFIFSGIQQVLEFEFLKFRILKIQTFTHAKLYQFFILHFSGFISKMSSE